MVERSRSGFTYRGNTQPQYQRGSILKTANRTKAFVDTLPNTMASFNNAVDTDMRSSIFDIMEKLQKEEQVTPVTRSDGFGATDMAGGDWVNVSTKALMKFEGFKVNLMMIVRKVQINLYGEWAMAVISIWKEVKFFL